MEMIIKILTFIALIGCIMAAINNKRVNQFRQKMLDDWAQRPNHPELEVMTPIINIVLGISIVLFIFLWPIIMVKKLLFGKRSD